MGYFFGHTRGAVSRVNGPWQNTPSFIVTVAGWPNKAGGGLFTSSLCTQAAVNAGGNIQFLHTINDTIFVYVFGDRITELTVSGTALAEPCNTRSSGIEEVIRLYTRDRIAVKAKPLIVSLGAASFNAFLTGFNAGINDPETLVGQFSFRFHCFPTTP